MERSDFIRNPSDFSFCLNPLDVNLAQMQMRLLERMKNAPTVGGVVFDTITEKYVSQNPEREYGEITVEIFKDRDSLSGTMYQARIIVANKQGDLVAIDALYKGPWNFLLRFIDGKGLAWGDEWNFFSLSKANALWLDYCIENGEKQHLIEMNEELLKKLRSEIDYLGFCIEGSRVYCHGHPKLHTGYTIGEGMAMFGEPCGPLYIVNTETNEVKQLVDNDGHVVGFSDQDFAWERLEDIKHRRCLDNMQADYGGIGRYGDFHNGVCCISWMLYSDGRHLADEDGDGMKDNEEDSIYCIIDRHFNVLFPFRQMASHWRDTLMGLFGKDCLSRDEFFTKEWKVTYEANPLDVYLDLARFEMRNRLREALPDQQLCEESFELNDPMMMLSTVSVRCCKVKGNVEKYYLHLRTEDNAHENEAIAWLAMGDEIGEIEYVLDSDQFVLKCKQWLKWFDYARKHYPTDDGSLYYRTGWRKKICMQDKSRGKVIGKAKCLGWGMVSGGAYGPVVSITRQLLEGCRLIVQSNAGPWYPFSDDMKNIVEKYGCGLKVTDVYMIERENFEAVLEPVPDAPQKMVYVNGIRRMSAANAYVLSTDFCGEFYIFLYREDPDGNRIFLWGDDYIFK